MSDEKKVELFCSFCGISNKATKKLICGPNAFICDSCVELCVELLKEENVSDCMVKENLEQVSEALLGKTE